VCDIITIHAKGILFLQESFSILRIVLHRKLQIIFAEISRNNSTKEIESCINNLMLKAGFFIRLREFFCY
jgi:hypothetical protein